MAARTFVFIPPEDRDLNAMANGSIIPVRVKNTLINEETNEVTIFFAAADADVPGDDQPGDDEEW